MLFPAISKRTLRHTHPNLHLFHCQKTPKRISSIQAEKAKGANAFRRFKRKVHICGRSQNTICCVQGLQVVLLAWVWSITSGFLCWLTFLSQSKYRPFVRRGLHVLCETRPSSE